MEAIVNPSPELSELPELLELSKPVRLDAVCSESDKKTKMIIRS